MTRKLLSITAALGIASLLLLPGAAAAHAPWLPGSRLPQKQPVGPGLALAGAENRPGTLPALSEIEPHFIAAGTASAQPPLQPSAGPDLFGYTFNAATYSWIAAAADTGLSGRYTSLTISLPFPFPFYEGVYPQVKIFSSGYLGFNLSDSSNSLIPQIIPSVQVPNGVIVPFGLDFTLATSGPSNRVFTASGGIAPDRYFVVLWNNLSYAGETYTFETILYENGDILFQYNQSLTPNGFTCAIAGIEDSFGQDGLVSKPFCSPPPSSGSALRFTRPQVDAYRVRFFPDSTGSLGGAGQDIVHRLMVRNTGTLGMDTFDLTYIGSFSATLLDGDDLTLLSDTNGNAIPDSGPLAPGQWREVVVQVHAPADALIGDFDQAALTAVSAADPARQDSSVVSSAVPGRFAQIFSINAENGPRVMLNRPGDTRTVQAGPTTGYESAIAEIPGAGFITAWREFRCLATCGTIVSEIFFAVLNPAGVRILGPLKVEDLSGATEGIFEVPYALAVAPDGRAALLFSKDDGQMDRRSVAIAFINAWNGQIVLPAVNLTPNLADAAYSGISTAATANNRFVVGWTQTISAPSPAQENVFYQVFNTAGAALSPLTALTADTPSNLDGFSLADIIPYTGSQALILYRSTAYGGGYVGATVDGAGAVVRGPIGLAAFGHGLDAALLSDGRIGLSYVDGAGTFYSGAQPWLAEFWNNSDLSGLPDLTRSDPLINFDWFTDSPAPGISWNDFSARWTAIVTLPAGFYSFTTYGDDGSRLYIDDILSIDGWGTCCTNVSATLPITGGVHLFRFEMHEATGGASAKLNWTRTIPDLGLVYQTVHAALSPDTDPLTLAPYNPVIPTFLPAPAVTREWNGRAIVTWSGSEAHDYYALYYALLGPGDLLVTPPMIFCSDRVIGNPTVRMITSSEGYGAAPFTFQPLKIRLPLVRR